jgi:hypothetical protein
VPRKVTKAGQTFANATSQLELLANENKSLGASLGVCELNLGQLVALDASQKQRLADSNRELVDARAKVTQYAQAQAQAQARAIPGARLGLKPRPKAILADRATNLTPCPTGSSSPQP